VEHSYPNLDTDLGLNKELIEKLKSYLIDSGMPDAIHNANVRNRNFGIELTNSYCRKILFIL